MSEGQVRADVRARVCADAGDRCGYCLSHQRVVLGWLEIEHINPRSKGGSNDENNLWLSGRLCNGFKGTQTEGIDPVTRKRFLLFNPRRQRWSEHFAWSRDGTKIIGTTPCGRATVIALQLNNVIAVMVRTQWVAAGWHPPRGLS